MSFDIALSGIQAINEQLISTSNNIANAGTYGFKSSRANFSSMYSGGKASGTEIGSKTQSINQAGGILNTGRALDASINGRGFFISKDTRGAITYSRVGIFSSDKEGYLVDSAKHKVQGYSTLFDSAGRPTAGAPLSPLGDIQVPARQLAVEPTSKLTYASNMSADWTIKDAVANASLAFDKDNPSTYNSSKVSTVFDSLGTEHTLSQYFVKTAENTVTVHYAVDNVDETGVPNADPTIANDMTLAAPQPAIIKYDSEGQISSVTVTHSTAVDTTGLLVNPTPNADGSDAFINTDGTFTSDDGLTTTQTKTQLIAAAAPASSSADWIPVFNPVAYTQVVTTGAKPLTFNLDYTGSTQYVGEAITTTNTANGHAPGTLTGLLLEADGSVTAQYSNSVSQNIGSIALATFADENALVATSDTSWQASAASGTALDYRPGTGKAGSLGIATLEQSNVDLTSELVSMMTSQHNYQANSKIISTESAMLASLMQAL